MIKLDSNQPKLQNMCTESLIRYKLQLLNPLSPDSDQHQFSPNNIHILPREMIMRVNKMIAKDLLSNSLNYFFKEMYEGQYGEFICGYRGLKG